MILVDSSVWIAFFNGSDQTAVHILELFLEAEEEICLSDYILAEVLQGFKKDEDFETARRHLLLFPLYALRNSRSYVDAAQIYRKCRKQGVTIRKTADCLIAQTAIENKLILLHADADFDRIAQVCPLRVYQHK